MNLFRKLFWGGSMLALSAGSAFAGVTISSPANGSIVSSPFTLTAWASDCSSQPTAAMGYSFDNSTSTSTFNTASMNGPVNASTGWHILHVKAWGNAGAACDTDVAINVEQNLIMQALTIPTQAINVSSIQALDNWIGGTDAAGTGATNGSTSIVSSPSLFGSTRQFNVNFLNSGSERFDVSFGDDTTSTNFLYDAWVYLDSSSSQIANLEFDLNQVMPNGETVIFGFQCDGWSNTWDYTANGGTPTQPVDLWLHSSQYCNPRTWGTNTWHHVQIAYARNDAGQVLYQTVYLDNLPMPINVTVNSAFALGWAPTLLTNFQIDGDGSSGSATVYLDNLQIYRW
jgi:hypothetical protein